MKIESYLAAIPALLVFLYGLFFDRGNSYIIPFGFALLFLAFLLRRNADRNVDSISQYGQDDQDSTGKLSQNEQNATGNKMDVRAWVRAVSQTTGYIAVLLYVHVIFSVKFVLYADIAALLFLGVSVFTNIDWTLVGSRSAAHGINSGVKKITITNSDKKAKIYKVTSQATGGIAFALLAFDMSIISPYTDIIGLAFFGVSLFFNR